MTKGFWDDSDRPIAIAHRGGAGLYSIDRYRKENTFKSFKAAQKLGYEYLELDVTSTADGRVIVLHVTTDWFEVMMHKPSAPNARKMQTLTHDQLKTLLNRDIPTLDEVLKQFPKTKFLIDSKTDQVVEPLAKEIIKAKAYGRVYVNSFYIERIRRMQELLGDKITYGFIIGRYPRAINRQLRALINGQYANAGLTAAVIPYRFMNKELVNRLHKQGLKVLVWTPNTTPQINNAIACDVDGIISDNIKLLKEILDSQN